MKARKKKGKANWKEEDGKYACGRKSGKKVGRKGKTVKKEVRKKGLWKEKMNQRWKEEKGI